MKDPTTSTASIHKCDTPATCPYHWFVHEQEAGKRILFSLRKHNVNGSLSYLVAKPGGGFLACDGDFKDADLNEHVFMHREDAVEMLILGLREGFLSDES